jgi:nicotinate-nucleotide pyrophosphorylase (carboxylating)
VTPSLQPPPQHSVDEVLRIALEEDLDGAGDITTSAVVDTSTRVTAAVVARADGVVAGLDMGLRAFTLLDDATVVDSLSPDGRPVAAGAVLARVSGRAHPILAAERTCLNLLGHLSGIATATRQIADLVAHTKATIVDTRKTTPGLRALEKYAVRAGGGANHRFGLYDAVLIKDNHLAASGGVGAAVKAARAAVGHAVKVEVEVVAVSQVTEAVESGADAVLLDNMTTEQLREAVAAAAGRCLLEASGGITPETVVAVAETGVDLISLGWLTHSAPRWDVALDFDPPSADQNPVVSSR